MPYNASQYIMKSPDPGTEGGGPGQGQSRHHGEGAFLHGDWALKNQVGLPGEEKEGGKRAPGTR